MGALPRTRANSAAARLLRESMQPFRVSSAGNACSNHSKSLRGAAAGEMREDMVGAEEQLLFGEVGVKGEKIITAALDFDMLASRSMS